MFVFDATFTYKVIVLTTEVKLFLGLIFDVTISNISRIIMKFFQLSQSTLLSHNFESKRIGVLFKHRYDFNAIITIEP